jgi:hypothetical protein
MPFEYTDIEDEIVTVLAGKISESSLEIEAVHYPDSEDDYKRAIAKPRITVGFVSAIPGESKSTNPQVSVEVLTVICLIQARTKRGELGTHKIARKVIGWVAGFTPTHCGKLLYKGFKGNDTVYDPDSGIWSWEVEFSCTKMVVQAVPVDDADGPTLNEVTLNDQIS